MLEELPAASLLVKATNRRHGIVSTRLGISMQISLRLNCFCTFKPTEQMNPEVLLLL